MKSLSFSEYCRQREDVPSVLECLLEAEAFARGEAESFPLHEAIGGAAPAKQQRAEHRAVGNFFAMWNKLPPEVAEQAREKFRLLQTDPMDPSLNFKAWTFGHDIWQARVNFRWRALAKKTFNRSGGDVIPHQIV